MVFNNVYCHFIKNSHVKFLHAINFNCSFMWNIILGMNHTPKIESKQHAMIAGGYMK